ncbi:MAG: hypothetical protein JNK05_22335 [Myxococcales bacterium]|nr:hypothetical protein [Myxococcales bacterium]
MSDLRSRRRTRRAMEIAAVIAASLALHSMGLVAIGVRELPSRELMFRGEDGENGRRGAGSIAEFAVESPPLPTVASRPSAPAAPVVEQQPEAPIVVQQPRPAPRRAPPTVASTPTQAPTPVATPAPPQETTPEPAPTAGGQRTGSVGEQRGMLPSAARCRDAVAGTWRAHKYNPGNRDWVIFTLRINRLPDNRLQGTIRARSWTGDGTRAQPPGRCGNAPEDLDFAVVMPGQGSIVGRAVSFSAIEYRIERVYCRRANMSYSPDAFSGQIDEARQEFQSVNDDGHRDRNAPYVFRRIGCLAGDALPAASASAVTPAADGGSVAR